MHPERLLFARLAEMGITHEMHEHQPTFTVDQSRHLAESLPGGRSKSLLLEDKDGRLTLVTALGSSRVDLKAVGETIGARGRLSFAKPDVMVSTLGVEPGHLTPFALINDPAQRIGSVVLDAELLRHNPIWAHPLRNNASLAIRPTALEAFCALHAKQVIKLALAEPA